MLTTFYLYSPEITMVKWHLNCNSDEDNHIYNSKILTGTWLSFLLNIQNHGFWNSAWGHTSLTSENLVNACLLVLDPYSQRRNLMLRYLEELLFPFITTYKVRESVWRWVTSKLRALSRGWNCLARYQFLESPSSFSGPKNCFRFTVFALKIKVSIILKMIQWNY